MRRLPPMPSRTAIRWLVWACCWAFALLASRPALAAAPMCDERGASAIAPTPVLPARDVQIDVGTPLGCDAPVFVSVRSGWQAHPPVVVVDDGSNEAWVKPRLGGLAPSTSDGDLARFASLPPVSSEYGRGVFRPPRS